MSLTEKVSPFVAYVLMGITVVLWASAFAGIRFMLRELDATTFTSLRLAFGLLGMLGIGVALRVSFPKGKDLLRIAAAGLLGFTIYHLALNFGTRFITAGQASFVTSTIPIWTALLAWLTLTESIRPRHWVGLAVSIAGIGWMSIRPDQIAISVGSGLVLLAAWCAAGNIIIQKELLNRYRATEITVWATSIGSLPIIALLPFRTEALAGMSTTGWWVTAYLGVVPIALGYWLATIALETLSASRSSQMLLFIPPIAALIAWLTIGEEPDPRVYYGGAVVLLGVAITVSRGAPKHRSAV